MRLSPSRRKVAEAAVVGATDDLPGQGVVAFITLRREAAELLAAAGARVRPLDE